MICWHLGSILVFHDVLIWFRVSLGMGHHLRFWGQLDLGCQKETRIEYHPSIGNMWGGMGVVFELLVGGFWCYCKLICITLVPSGVNNNHRGRGWFLVPLGFLLFVSMPRPAIQCRHWLWGMPSLLWVLRLCKWFPLASDLYRCQLIVLSSHMLRLLVGVFS